MGKRASVAPKASPAKRQSVAASPKPARSPAKPAPVYDPLAEVFKVLKKRLDKATADMLIEALPLALKVDDSAAPRHEFQERMLDSAAMELSKAVELQQELVSVTEREQAALEEDMEQTATAAVSVITALAERKKECDDAEEAIKPKNAALEEASGAFEAAKKHADAAEGDRKDMERHRDDFVAGLAELFEPLKASEIPGTKWRERRRKQAELLEKFKTIGIEESLQAAVDEALKIKVDARGEFAQSAVTHAEEAYREYIDAQQDKIDGFGSEISARAAAVSEAEVGVKAAQEAVGVVQQASIDAQNAWIVEQTKELELKSNNETYEPRKAALQKKLLAAYTELGELQAVSKDLAAQRSAKPPTAEAPVEVEAAAVEPPATEAAAKEPAGSAP